MAEERTPRNAEEQELIEIRNEFIEESLEGLGNAANDVVAFETSPENTSLVDRVFRTAHSIIHVLSQEMQRSILEIRKVTASTLLRRVPRIARDVAGSLGKEVSLQIEGETVLIDKSIAEALDAPLVHMVRNAVDHGVEPPSVRSSRGKAPSGRVRVSIAATSNDIVLTVEDDGQGIDHDKLLRRAVAQGLVAEG